MKLPNFTVLQLTIQGFVDSREVVNKLNEFYANTGVVISQKAKYEKPTWFYILSCLGGRPKTIQQIVDKLRQHNLNIGYQTVHRFLKIMMNTRAAIHPHRRNCGVSCHELVTLFGGVICDVMAVNNNVGRGAPSDVYYLGADSQSIAYYKRVHNVYIEP